MGPARSSSTAGGGELVPSGDAKALAASIKETLAEPGDPQQRQTRAMQFSVQAISESYRLLIARLCGASA